MLTKLGYTYTKLFQLPKRIHFNVGDTQKNPFKKAYTYFRVYTIQHTYIYITLYFYHTYKIIMSTTILVNIFTIRGYIVRKNFIPAKLEKQMIL